MRRNHTRRPLTNGCIALAFAASLGLGDLNAQAPSALKHLIAISVKFRPVNVRV